MAVSVKSNKNFLWWLSAVFLPTGFLSSTSAEKAVKIENTTICVFSSQQGVQAYTL